MKSTIWFAALTSIMTLTFKSSVSPSATTWWRFAAVSCRHPSCSTEVAFQASVDKWVYIVVSQSDGSENIQILVWRLVTFSFLFTFHFVSSKFDFSFSHVWPKKIFFLFVDGGEESSCTMALTTSPSSWSLLFQWETVIKSARKGCNVFAEQGQLGIAESRCLGYERKAVLHRCRDSRLGYRLLCTTAYRTRRRSQKLHSAVAEDF